MYRVFLIVNIVATMPLVLVGARMAASVSAPFPAGFLWYYPVTLGLFGVLGLCRVLAWRTSDQCRWRNDVVFLSAGLLAAVLVLVGTSVITANLSVFAWLFPAALLAGPAAVALLEIRRRSTSISDLNAIVSGHARVILFILLLPVALGVTRLAAKEALIAWYAVEFPENAIASAERIAAGGEYRIRVDGYLPAVTLDELDERALLSRAFENHLLVGGMNGVWIEPHIRLHVGDARYFWSFRAGEFAR